MTKLLHCSILLFTILIANFGNAQSTIIVNDLDPITVNESIVDIQTIMLGNDTVSCKKVFSYMTEFLDVKYKLDHDHSDHIEGVTLIDIISSEESTDFNCSGGFCMNDLHFHKKGLTSKKQFFGYFMSISC